MTAPNCKIETCKNHAVKAELCSAHYKLRKTSDFAKILVHRHKGLANRIAAHTRVEGECLMWTGSKYPNGYAKINVNGRSMLAHRVSYEMHFGKIPAGHELHHTCENPACVAPLHLQLSTRKQHLQMHDYPRGEDGRFLPHSKE